jgi:hypothetical protein
MAGLSNLREAYASVYDTELRQELQEDNLEYIDLLSDEDIEDVVLQVSEELEDFGYSLNESLEAFEVHAIELVEAKVTYGQGSTLAAKARVEKRKSERSEAEKTARAEKRAARVDRVKGAIKKVGSMAKAAIKGMANKVEMKPGDSSKSTAARVQQARAAAGAGADRAKQAAGGVVSAAKAGAKKKLASALRSVASPGGAINRARRQVNKTDRQSSGVVKSVVDTARKIKAKGSAAKERAVSYANRKLGDAEKGARNLANRLDPPAKKGKKKPMGEDAYQIASDLAENLVEQGFARDFEGGMTILANMNPDYIEEMMQDIYELNFPMQVNVADMKGNTPAYQGYLKGKKMKDGSPMYKAGPGVPVRGV